jgi:hypothetical protein
MLTKRTTCAIHDIGGAIAGTTWQVLACAKANADCSAERIARGRGHLGHSPSGIDEDGVWRGDTSRAQRRISLQHFHDSHDRRFRRCGLRAQTKSGKK